MTTEEVIDIREPIKTICDALGLEHTAVARLEMQPGSIEATVYKRNDDDKFYIEDSGEAACVSLRFKVLA